jgi:SAM-dependent methyltransferase
VYDLDDNYWELDPESQDGQYLRTPHRLEQTERYLKNASLVRVYNPNLYRKVSQYSSKTVLLNPCIDLSLTPKTALPKSDEKTRIIYVTSRGDLDPFVAVFSSALVQILEKYPQKVEAFFWGRSEKYFERYPNVKGIPIVNNYEQYIQSLSRSGYDIGLAPIIPDSFTLSKTDTKFRDYTACRIAGIYSNCEVYTQSIEHEKTGLLVDNSTLAWFQAMERLIADETLRAQIIKDAYQYVFDNYRQELMEEQWLAQIHSLLQMNESTRDIETQVLTSSALPNTIARNKEIKIYLGKKDEVESEFFCLGKDDPQEVDTISDLNFPLPLPDNTVDLLVANRTLDQANDLMATLKEIYRVCKHGAQVCIVAAYNLTQLHLANPNQPTAFNEYSPWFWTEFQPGRLTLQGHEHTTLWNLKLSKHDFPAPPIDIRCVKITFFYSPEYRNLPSSNQELARKKYLNVCDQIMYNLIVIKQNTSDDEVTTMTSRWQYFEPPQVTARRYQDLYEIAQAEIEQSKSLLTARETQFEQTQEQSEQTLSQLEQTLAQLKNTQEESAQTKSLLTERDAQLEQALAQSRNLLEIKVEADRAKLLIADREAQLEAISNQLQQVQANLEETSHQLARSNVAYATLNNEFEQYKNKASFAVKELDGFRKNRAIRLIRKLRDRTDAKNDVSLRFKQFIDDSLIFYPNLKGYILQPSVILQDVPYIEYPILWLKPNLEEIQVSPICDIMPARGMLGIELVSPFNEILFQTLSEAKNIDGSQPVSFHFKSISSTREGCFLLRIFARDTDVPIRVFEWRKYPAFGLAPIKRHPFCAFRFAI